MARKTARLMAMKMASWAENDQALFAGRVGYISLLRKVMTRREEEEEMEGKRPEHGKASPCYPFREMKISLPTSNESSVLEMKIHSLAR